MKRILLIRIIVACFIFLLPQERTFDLRREILGTPVPMEFIMPPSLNSFNYGCGYRIIDFDLLKTRLKEAE